MCVELLSANQLRDKFPWINLDGIAVGSFGMCVIVCVCVCVRACVRACVCVHVFLHCQVTKMKGGLTHGRY